MVGELAGRLLSVLCTGRLAGPFLPLGLNDRALVPGTLPWPPN